MSFFVFKNYAAFAVFLSKSALLLQPAADKEQTKQAM